jgi:hypothetical protein
MKISAYLEKWDQHELRRFTKDQLKIAGINELTQNFLIDFGLPESAAPFVSFDRKELLTIHQIYETDDNQNKFYVDIGSDGGGNPLCIDTSANCQIVALDHENNFSKRYVNASVKELFIFLTLYKEFGEDLQNQRGEQAFIDSKFTDEELEELFSKLKAVDKRALEDDSTFWSIEIGYLIANRGNMG